MTRHFVPASSVHALLQGLNDDSRGATTAVTDTSAADLALLLLQHTKQGGCDPGTGCTESVSKRNSTTVEVDFVFRDTQDLHVGQSNNTEGFVDLERVNGRQLDLGVLESLGHGERRRGGEFGWVLLSIAPAQDLANGLQVVLLDGGFGGEDKGGSAIGERRGVRSGDRAIFLERGSEGACLGLIELVILVNNHAKNEQNGTHVLGLVILVDDNCGLTAALSNLNRRDLRGKPASLRGSNRLLVRADAVFVLVLAVEAMVVCTLLALKTHVLLLVRVGQTVLEDTVDKRLVTELGASPHDREVVRSVGHALRSSSDDNVRIAGYDGLRTDDERFDRGGADLVDGGCDGGFGETSADGTLAGRVLTEATICIREAHRKQRLYILCGKNITNKDFLDVFGLQAGALDGCYRLWLAQFAQIKVVWQYHTLDSMRA